MANRPLSGLCVFCHGKPNYMVRLKNVDITKHAALACCWRCTGLIEAMLGDSAEVGGWYHKPKKKQAQEAVDMVEQLLKEARENA